MRPDASVPVVATKWHMPLAATLSIIAAVVVMALAVLASARKAPRGRRWDAALRAAVPWLLVVVLGGMLAAGMARYIEHVRGGEALEWKSRKAFYLWPAGLLVGLIAFHLQRARSATLGFSQTSFIAHRGIAAWLSDLPAVLRVLAICALVVALMRPETFRMLRKEEDSIDIMIVFDMSKSMEETDMPRDRMDAAQRVVRRFLRRTTHDRVGLVIFGQQAMLQCPLTQDAKLVEGIVRDLMIGDVPALGTAIGDGLALALAQLRRSDGLCGPGNPTAAACPVEMSCTKEGYCKGPKQNKVVILLSDGDSNWTTRFDPDDAARTARDLGVKVYTVLVGRESSDFLGFGGSVNPETLRSIAQTTGGDFFRATDYDTFDRGFQAVRNQLDKTKRVTIERVAGKPLFVPFAVLALMLGGLGLVLSHTRLRRLP